MTKKKQPEDPGNGSAGGAGDQEKPKRQRANASIAALFAPFIPELKTYAQAKYDEVRYDQSAPDEQLAARDQLRKAIAQLGGQ